MSLKRIFNLKTADEIIKKIEEETADLKPVSKTKKKETKPKETYDKDGNLIIQSKMNDE